MYLQFFFHTNYCGNPIIPKQSIISRRINLRGHTFGKFHKAQVSQSMAYQSSAKAGIPSLCFITQILRISNRFQQTHDLPNPTAAFFIFRVFMLSGVGNPVLSSYFFSSATKFSRIVSRTSSVILSKKRTPCR